MKSNLLKNVLDWVLATSVILTIIFFVQFYFRTKEYRTLSGTIQIEAAKYQNNNNTLNLLGNATLEYSKTHPDANLNRILDLVRTAPPAEGAAPVTKPAVK